VIIYSVQPSVTLEFLLVWHAVALGLTINEERQSRLQFPPSWLLRRALYPVRSNSESQCRAHLMKSSRFAWPTGRPSSALMLLLNPASHMQSSWDRLGVRSHQPCMYRSSSRSIHRINRFTQRLLVRGFANYPMLSSMTRQCELSWLCAWTSTSERLTFADAPRFRSKRVPVIVRW
jgi:hypothetical protein